MISKRLQYLLLLIGAGAYFLASGAWLSWIILVVMVGLPWLSLLLSLPALLTFQVSPAGPRLVEMGEDAELWLVGSSRWPMPPFQGRIRVHELLTGDHWRYDNDTGLDTQHCGGYLATVERGKVCDYLGLFAFRIRHSEEIRVIVRPRPLPVGALSDPQRTEINRWVPKAGGGYSENHEHRPYRPGDSLNQLHWKLSAKVGELIVREPMEPIQGNVLLTMRLQGTPEVLDRKFGRLLWVGQYLLERELDFDIRALTGQGVANHHVESTQELLKAVDALLCTEPAPEDEEWNEIGDAFWQYHIGGDADEA